MSLFSRFRNFKVSKGQIIFGTVSAIFVLWILAVLYLFLWEKFSLLDSIIAVISKSFVFFIAAAIAIMIILTIDLSLPRLRKRSFKDDLVAQTKIIAEHVRNSDYGPQLVPYFLPSIQEIFSALKNPAENTEQALNAALSIMEIVKDDPKFAESWLGNELLVYSNSIRYAFLVFYLPKHKGDVFNAIKIISLGYPMVEPVLGQLFLCIQDMNWAVAKQISPFLAGIGDPIIPYVQDILHSGDEIWKYSMLSQVVKFAPKSVALTLKDEISRIAFEPTDAEKRGILPEIAHEILAQFELIMENDANP